MKKISVRPEAFNLRMSESLKAQLREAAMGNSRSLNQEIVHRLTKSLKPSYRP